MRQYLPLVATITFFTLVYLLDIWSTSLFLNSPFCVESNPLFAPFSKTPFLLDQLYFSGWFIPVAISGYIHLLIKRMKGPWWVELFCYWAIWGWGIQHLLATVYNLSILPRCWG
jgi:hypothetical protein